MFLSKDIIYFGFKRKGMSFKVLEKALLYKSFKNSYNLEEQKSIKKGLREEIFRGVVKRKLLCIDFFFGSD